VSAALELGSLTKTFPGGRALDDVSFSVEAGTVHVLVGGNGSGKSTLVKGLAGVQPLDRGGWIRVGDETVAAEEMTPAKARAAGLRFVHQHPGMFPTMTVADNIALSNSFPSRAGRVRRRELMARTTRLLEAFRIDVSPTTLVGELQTADQTMIAIARALQDQIEGTQPLRTVVLDEPTASLPEDEAGLVLSTVRRAAETGVAVIYISHRLEELTQVGDAFTVLRDGRHIVTRQAAGVNEAALIEYISGRPLEPANTAPALATGTHDVVLSVNGLSAAPLSDISFEVRAGEILGIAGLLGSGRSEILHSLFGSRTVEAGSAEVSGRPLTFGDIARTMAAGVALVPEDRAGEAMFPDQSLRHNLSIANLSAYSKFGRMRAGEERRRARDAIRSFTIKAKSDSQVMSSLSGGNQQKVVLARWMDRHPKVLLLDEPTQGVDVGARAEAYAIIRRAAASGVATVVVSSDFEELAELSDRVLILTAGRIAGEVRGPNIDRHRLTELTLVSKGIEQ
jgi:ribose transport system ATP-binding protein